MEKEIFVQNIKRICAERGVKPTVACRESGAGKDLINNLETRGSMPSVEKVQLLANYLGVTTSDLLGEPPAELDELEKRVIGLFRQIPAEERDNMLLAVEVALRSRGLLE